MSYQDFDFSFRRKMIRNVPYFRNIDDNLANEIAFLMKPKRYEEGSVVVKRGDNVNTIMLLKAGEIEVLVPPHRQ
jgi:CRP-like cAMP-binding protein